MFGLVYPHSIIVCFRATPFIVGSGRCIEQPTPLENETPTVWPHLNPPALFWAAASA